MILMGGTKVAEYAHSQTYYYHTDHKGSIRFETRNSGAVTEEWDSYPFGETWIYSGFGFGNELHYTGHRRDPETDNDFAGARYYASASGRWLSVDQVRGQLSNPQLLNRYAYVGNDPLNFIDPDGRFRLGVIPFSGEWSFMNPPGTGQNFGPSFPGVPFPEIGIPTTGTGEFPGGGGPSGGAGPPGQTAAELLDFWRNGKALWDDCFAKIESAIAGNSALSSLIYNNILETLAAAAVAPDTAGLLTWFVLKVKTGGPWDFKNQPGFAATYGFSGNLEDLGNFNFGVVSAALGLPITLAQAGAGWYQFLSDLRRSIIGGSVNISGSGTPFTPPFMDQLKDANKITEGHGFFYEMKTCMEGRQ